MNMTVVSPNTGDTGLRGTLNQGFLGSIASISLSDLEDVSISSPEANQILRYDSTEQKWKNTDATIVRNGNTLEITNTQPFS